MNLFEFDRSSYTVRFTEEAALLKPFNDIIKRDKTKDKTKAINELAVVWFVADLSSDFQYILDENARIIEAATNTSLPKDWKPDKKVKDAIKFYQKSSTTISSILYEGTLIAVNAVNDVFKDAKKLISESDDKIAASEKIIRAVEKVPGVMEKLNKAEKQLIKEKSDNQGNMVGSQEMNLFEDGL